MKSYIQGLITGSVLVFACVVLMGQKNNNGRYAVSTTDCDGSWACETIIETNTGEVVSRKLLTRRKYEKIK